MAHYINAAKLIAEIERLEGENNCGTSDFIEAKRIAYNQVKKVLDSLQQEQPEVDLEEEIERMKNWWEHNIGKTIPGFENIARHFYELGRKAKEDK